MLETNDLNRDLRIPNLRNVRDLGGLPTRTGQTTRWRSLLRADDLHHLTPAGLQALHDYGVATVLDLRRVSGIGLKTAQVLYRDFGIKSLDELKVFVEGGGVNSVPGLGEKTTTRIKSSLARLQAQAANER